MNCFGSDVSIYRQRNYRNFGFLDYFGFWSSRDNLDVDDASDTSSVLSTSSTVSFRTWNKTQRKKQERRFWKAYGSRENFFIFSVKNDLDLFSFRPSIRNSDCLQHLDLDEAEDEARSKVDLWTVEEPCFDPPQSSAASGFENFSLENDGTIKSHTPDSDRKNEWLMASLQQSRREGGSGQCGRFVVSHPWKGKAKVRFMSFKPGSSAEGLNAVSIVMASQLNSTNDTKEESKIEQTRMSDDKADIQFFNHVSPIQRYEVCTSETEPASGNNRANKIGEVTVSTPLFDQAPNFDSLKIRFLTIDGALFSKKETEMTLVKLDTPNISKLLTRNTQNFSFMNIADKAEPETTVSSEESCNQSSKLSDDSVVPLLPVSTENNRVKIESSPEPSTKNNKIFSSISAMSASDDSTLCCSNCVIV